MPTKRVNAATAAESFTGKSIAQLGEDYVLVRVGPGQKNPAPRPDERAAVLLAKVGKALSKPGIDKKTIFKGAKLGAIYAYSAYPGDTRKVLREAADGSQTVGRLIKNGQFRRIAKAAA